MSLFLCVRRGARVVFFHRCSSVTSGLFRCDTEPLVLCLGSLLRWSSHPLVHAPLVPWSSGLSILGCSVAAFGKLEPLQNTASGAFEKIELLQITVFVGLKGYVHLRLEKKLHML